MKLGLNWIEVAPSSHLTGALSDRRLEIPTRCDWQDEACRIAGVVIANGDARGNTDHSCCVPAGAWQAVRIMRAIVAGDTRDFTTPQVMQTYADWSGYNWTPETDLGTRSDLAGALWGSKGLWLDDQLEDVPQVVPLGLDHLRAAVAFLGPVQLDVALRQDWQDSATWGLSSAPLWGAHRVVLTGYNLDGFDVLTWGKRVWISNAALAAYGLGAWACIDRLWLDTHGEAPPGLDLAALEIEARGMAA